MQVRAQALVQVRTGPFCCRDARFMRSTRVLAVLRHQSPEGPRQCVLMGSLSRMIGVVAPTAVRHLPAVGTVAPNLHARVERLPTLWPVRNSIGHTSYATMHLAQASGTAKNRVPSTMWHSTRARRVAKFREWLAAHTSNARCMATFTCGARTLDLRCIRGTQPAPRGTHKLPLHPHPHHLRSECPTRIELQMAIACGERCGQRMTASTRCAVLTAGWCVSSMPSCACVTCLAPTRSGSLALRQFHLKAIQWVRVLAASEGALAHKLATDS